MSLFRIPTVDVNDSFVTIFSEVEHDKLQMGGMLLTDRIDAVNFRLRESEPGYKTEFHLAGDPTLIIIQKGTLRITLQNGNHKDFSAGDMFIAKDALPEVIAFDKNIHGHCAEVIGEQPLKAVHIKLESLNG